MTVKELIEELSKLDQDADVSVPDDACGWEYDIVVSPFQRTDEQCKAGQEPYSFVRIS